MLQMINSKHFDVHQLAEGVYAALHRAGGRAVCNTCIVDLGDRTLVFDTSLTPQAAIDINLAAEALTDKQVTLIVNSHYHIDHTWGNQAFNPDIDIISSETTYQQIETKNPEVFRRYKENLANRNRDPEALLNYLLAELRKPDDSGLWRSYYEGILEAAPRVRLRTPNMTFNQYMTIHGSRRTVELYAFSGGHTQSDTVLFLPEERILFTGDLIYINSHPSLLEAQPDALLHILDELIALEPKAILPGHGPIASIDSLESLKEYVNKIRTIAAKKLAAGANETQIRRTMIPRKYKNWDLGDHFHSNLLQLYSRLAHGGGHTEGLLPADISQQQSI